MNTLLHFISSNYKTDVQVFSEQSTSQKIKDRSLLLEIAVKKPIKTSKSTTRYNAYSRSYKLSENRNAPWTQGLIEHNA